MSRLSTDDGRTTECEDRARILETEFAKICRKIGGKISISDPHTITFSKIWHMFCLCATLTEAVFVYFVVCLCIYVFVICASDTLEYCFFEVLVPLPFQKYSIC